MFDFSPPEQWVDRASLTPHPKNYKRHPAEQVREMAESLRQFTQTKPIIIWNGFIIAGHGLWEAAGEAQRQEVLVRDYSEVWDEATALAYIAVDNKTAEMGVDDLTKLAELAESARNLGANAGVSGLLDRLANVGAQAAQALAQAPRQNFNEMLLKHGPPPGRPQPPPDEASDVLEEDGEQTEEEARLDPPEPVEAKRPEPLKDRWPLAIVVNLETFRAWREFKKSQSARDDGAAFMRLWQLHGVGVHINETLLARWRAYMADAGLTDEAEAFERLLNQVGV